MTEKGIPLYKSDDLPEPLESIVALIFNTRWHEGEDEMNAATVKSTLDSIRWLVNRKVIGHLPDETPLYFHDLSSWNGATGWWYGETEDGRVYRQRQVWLSDEPDPQKWERVLLRSNTRQQNKGE